MSVQPPIPERNTHPFYTHDMIFEIPQAISDTLRNNTQKAKDIATGVKGKELFYFTGCGTAYFAAILGRYFLSAAESDKIKAASVQALEFSNYYHTLDKTSVAVGISHSGITKTTVDALRHAKEKGAFCVGITHFRDRPISNVVDETVVAGNSPDTSRCHTKCYVAGAVACAQIGIELFRARNGKLATKAEHLQSPLEGLPQIASKVLNSTEKTCEQLADQYLTKDGYYFAGAGPNISTALEAALKIMETSFVHAQGFETEQLLHGPWVSLNGNGVLVVAATKGRSYQRSVDLVKAAKILGIPIIGLVSEGDSELSSLCDDAIELPLVDEYLSPLVNIIPLYLFSYYLSIKRGFNPDYLRYLTPKYWEARQVIFPPGTH